MLQKMMLLELVSRFRKSHQSSEQVWTANSTQTRRMKKERVSKNSTSTVMFSRKLRDNRRSNTYQKKLTKLKNLRWTKISISLSTSQILTSVMDLVLSNQNLNNKKSKSSHLVLTSKTSQKVGMAILISKKHLSNKTISSISMSRMPRLDRILRQKYKNLQTHLMSYLMCSMHQPKSLLKRHNKI